MIEFREIDRTNWEACVKLEVEEGQRSFVAPNAYSLAQAAYEPDMYPYGIYRDGEMVGFVMYDYDPDIEGWGMCRLMVDKRFQGQGIGRMAVEKLLGHILEKLGHIKFYTSAEPENNVAIALYEKMGFKKTGKIYYDEVQLMIQL